MQIDDMDKMLLGYLQEDARITNTELARRVNLSPPGLQKRVKKLEENGIIERYSTVLNREAMGYEMIVFVDVSLERHDPDFVTEFREWAQTMPEVLECHHVTGNSDYLLKVLVRNRKHLEQFLVEGLTPVRGVADLVTRVVLNEVKESTTVPIE